MRLHGGCHLRMPVRVDDVPGSGCRLDCLHRVDVLAYRDAKALADEARKLAREAAPHDPRVTNLAAWDAAHPPLTYLAWLKARRNPERIAS